MQMTVAISEQSERRKKKAYTKNNMAGESNMNIFLMQMNTTIDYYFMIVILWQSEKQKGSNDSLRNSETQKKSKIIM